MSRLKYTVSLFQLLFNLKPWKIPGQLGCGGTAAAAALAWELGPVGFGDYGGDIQGFILDGQGDVVSRFITPITHIVTIIIPIPNLLIVLSAADPPSRDM